MNSKDQKKFNAIKARVKDLRSCHGEDIREGKFIRMTGTIVAEMDWLIKRIEPDANTEAPAVVEETEDAEAEEVVEV